MNSRRRASSSTTSTSGPLGLPAGAGAVEERLEVAAPVAPVAAGRVEGRHAALVGPLADRRLGHAEELGRLAERQPVGLARSRLVSRGRSLPRK